MKRAILAVVACVLSLALAADSFRSAFAGNVKVNASLPEGEKRSFGVTESISVQLEGDLRFLVGIEVELKCPKAVSASPGALGFMLWSELSPPPDPAVYSYSGKLLLSQGVGPKLSYVFQIPLRKDHGLKAGPYAVLVPALLSKDSFPLAAKLFPFSKDLPYEIESGVFNFKVRPLISDEGALGVIIRYPEGAAAKPPATILIDEKRTMAPGDEILIKSGVHNVRVSCEGFREFHKTVAIEAGKSMVLEVLLEDTIPRIIVDAPESALITVDGMKIEKIGPEGFAIEPGEHTIVVKVGDYTVTRKIMAERGKKYRISFKVDLLVVEE